MSDRKIRFYTKDALYIAELPWSDPIDDLPQVIEWTERGTFIQSPSDRGAYYQPKATMFVDNKAFQEAGEL